MNLLPLLAKILWFPEGAVILTSWPEEPGPLSSLQPFPETGFPHPSLCLPLLLSLQPRHTGALKTTANPKTCCSLHVFLGSDAGPDESFSTFPQT